MKAGKLVKVRGPTPTRRHQGWHRGRPDYLRPWVKVDMGFCLVAQPWTYKIFGGPSKLPKDFPWPIPNHSSPP